MGIARARERRHRRERRGGRALNREQSSRAVVDDRRAELAGDRREREYQAAVPQEGSNGQHLDRRADVSDATSDLHRNAGPAAREHDGPTVCRDANLHGDAIAEGMQRRHHGSADDLRADGARDERAVDGDADRKRRNQRGRPFARLVGVFRAAGLRFSSDGCAFLAQAIAFNALFAIFPIVILGIGILALLFGTDRGQADATRIIADLAPSVQSILLENLAQLVDYRGISGLVSILALIWSGKNLFLALTYALDRALGVPKARPFLNDMLVAIVMLPILGAILVAATAVPVVLSVFLHYGRDLAATYGRQFSGVAIHLHNLALPSQIVGYGFGGLLVFVIATILYDYLPNRRVPPSFGVPGAIVTAIAWEAAQIAFAVYTTHVNFVHVYGAISAFAILLLWLYYMATIFLFGAEFSAQWFDATDPDTAVVGAKNAPARDG